MLADYPFKEGDTIIVNDKDFETVRNDLLHMHAYAQVFTMYKWVKSQTSICQIPQRSSSEVYDTMRSLDNYGRIAKISF